MSDKVFYADFYVQKPFYQMLSVEHPDLRIADELKDYELSLIIESHKEDMWFYLVCVLMVFSFTLVCAVKVINHIF